MAGQGWTFDQKYLGKGMGLIGVDEAGRGALAGPVGAAAVYVSKDFYKESYDWPELDTITDSKALSPENRRNCYQQLLAWDAQRRLRLSYAEGSLEMIEQKGIVFANQYAMHQAIKGLGGVFGITILVDGHPLKDFAYAHTAIVKGDTKSLAIGMASIVAKVLRDRELESLSKRYPSYGLGRHKGYGTAQHRQAIQEQGPHPELHRSLYLRKLLGDG